MLHPEGSQGQRSAWEPCPLREAPSYRPLPRNVARGLAPACPRSTHPPFWGAGLARAVTWDWPRAEEEALVQGRDCRGPPRGVLSAKRGACQRPGQPGVSSMPPSRLTPGPTRAAQSSRTHRTQAGPPEGGRPGWTQRQSSGGRRCLSTVRASCPHGRRCRPGGSQALLGKVVCGDGCTALPGPAVSNLNPGRGLNQGLTQGPRHHGTSEAPWPQARPAGQPAATRVSHRTRACPPCGCLAPRGPGLSPLPSPSSGPQPLPSGPHRRSGLRARVQPSSHGWVLSLGKRLWCF